MSDTTSHDSPNNDATELKDRWHSEVLQWDAKIARAASETLRQANSEMKFRYTAGLHQMLVGLKAVLAALDELEETDVIELQDEIDDAFTDLAKEFHRRFSN